jgi:hypothetical protein
MYFFIQELGYRGDVGYQTFLYSSEADIRKIFMFLVDKLPKETVETTEETLGKYCQSFFFLFCAKCDLFLHKLIYQLCLTIFFIQLNQP